MVCMIIVGIRNLSSKNEAIYVNMHMKKKKKKNEYTFTNTPSQQVLQNQVQN